MILLEKISPNRGILFFDFLVFEKVDFEFEDYAVEPKYNFEHLMYNICLFFVF